LKILLLPTIATLCLTGCGGGEKYFPLEPGKRWTYKVRTPLYSYVEQVRVEERVPVGPDRGFKVSGEMGGSRIAWSGSQLKASLIGMTGFSPPITILDSGSKKAKVRWKGMVLLAGKTFSASAELVQDQETIALDGKKVVSLRTTLVLKPDQGSRVVELISWYVAGIGAVRQEQRTNGVLDLTMEWMHGS
jgi:hypothetical protein